MNKIVTGILRILLPLFVIGFAVVVVQAATFDCQLLGPTNSVLSPEAQAALAYLIERDGFDIGELTIVNEFTRESALLNRIFRSITVLNLKSGQFFQLLVDQETKQVEFADIIEENEKEAMLAKYGKLQPALYEYLKTVGDTETVTVMIWLAAEAGSSLAEREDNARNMLASKYPEVQHALDRGGKPMDVEDPILAERIYAEYVELLKVGLGERAQPLVKVLQNQGYIDIQISEDLPAMTVSLPPSVILSVAQRNDVSTIYLAEEDQFQRFLSSAVSTNLAPVVWEQGYDGTGVNIAILEDGNVDFTSDTVECPISSNNCFQHPGAIQGGISGQLWHTTLVASAASSNHPVNRGMAPGATVISAGMLGEQRIDAINALIWSFDNGANIVNISGGFCTTEGQMGLDDRGFDYNARSHLRLIVAAAGEETPFCTNNYVASPAKGWNVLAVGAYDDLNDLHWWNDLITDWSNWQNPDSINGDREKPEIVAPGVSITGIELNGNLKTSIGNSFSAPQVSGLAALLIDRNPELSYWPEANRAIIMASAVHNIVGPTGIPTGVDLQDGAGGINAFLADTVAQVRNQSDVNPCTASCWWGIYITNNSFPVGAYLDRFFTAESGDFIRIAIAWWSNADTPANNYSFDRLDTDLQLGAHDPDGMWVGWSASHDNNYELIEFVAPKSGQYKIKVYKQRADETSNYLGIALVHFQDKIYLPMVVKQ